MKDGERHVVCFIVLAMLLSLIPAARGEWRERYAQNPPAVNQWYKDAQMNDATWERLGKPSWRGCCEKGDVFKTQFPVGGDNSDQWWYLSKENVWKRGHPTPSIGGNMLPIDCPPFSSTGRAKSCASIRPRKAYRDCNCSSVEHACCNGWWMSPPSLGLARFTFDWLFVAQRGFGSEFYAWP
jgi:hypothetical protein